jgi:L-serine dehydratase
MSPDYFLIRMPVSTLDLFTIGLGPSSSHTVGPMRAARRFVMKLEDDGLDSKVARIRCDLYGSLAATGKGHGTDRAVLLGLLGEQPEKVSLDAIESRLAEIKESGFLQLPWGQRIPFEEKNDLQFKRVKPLPLHPNGMHFLASDAEGVVVAEEVVYSVGGGFIASEAELSHPRVEGEGLPFPFKSAVELMAHCEVHHVAQRKRIPSREDHTCPIG